MSRPPTDVGPAYRPKAEHKEFWWIYSPRKEEWGGLRIATFITAMNGVEILFIIGERMDRIGARGWEHVQEAEGWMKVSRIELPTQAQIKLAILAEEEKHAKRSEADHHS